MAPADHYLRLRRYLSQLHVERSLQRIEPVCRVLRALDRRLISRYPPDTRLRHEFNLWAEKGLGERMQDDHLWFTVRALERMCPQPEDRILDLGCGEGWACRLLGGPLGNRCSVLGIDISDEMIHRAYTKSTQFPKVTFLCASAEHIPCSDETFTKVLSISAFYYFADQATVLSEVVRVLAPGGQFLLLTALYKDLPDWLCSTDGLRVPVQICSTAEYKAVLRAAGWANVEAEEFVREDLPGRIAQDHNRALLITACKPKGKASIVLGRDQQSISG